MKSDLPKGFKAGDELTADIVDGILGEVWRWRRVQAMPPLHVSEADSDAPPVFSFFQGKYIDGAWGSTGPSGFDAAAGTPPVPTSRDIVLYDITPGSPPVMTGQSVYTTAWNPYSHSVAANKTAFFCQTIDGTWWILTADC